jgi:hypothetical protein
VNPMTTHYVPTKNGPTWDQRFSLCGVRTRVGGPREWDLTAAFGSSNMQHVDCEECKAAEKSSHYQSAVLVSVSPNCCNPYVCTRCGSSGGGPICCDEDDRVSDLARRYFGPHPIRQPLASADKVSP